MLPARSAPLAYWKWAARIRFSDERPNFFLNQERASRRTVASSCTTSLAGFGGQSACILRDVAFEMCWLSTTAAFVFVALMTSSGCGGRSTGGSASTVTGGAAGQTGAAAGGGSGGT